MGLKTVPGKKRGDVVIYALSTCGWCRKTKLLLDQSGVEYCYVDVDLEEGSDKESLVEEIKKWNPKVSFPTVVIDKKKCIVGFKEDEIKEALNL
jgi:glutaredoxin-like protein NrdH